MPIHLAILVRIRKSSHNIALLDWKSGTTTWRTKMRNLTAKERLFCAISTLLRFMAQCSTRHQGRWRLSMSISGTKINTDARYAEIIAMLQISKLFMYKKRCSFLYIKNVAAATGKINSPPNFICHFNIQAKECQVLMNLFALWGHTRNEARYFNTKMTKCIKNLFGETDNSF